MDVGIFRLVNPPPGQEEIIRQAIALIDYPWELIDHELRYDQDKAVLIEWDDTGQGVSGVYEGGTHTIRLSGLERDLGPQAAFVFAHEVGHLVDMAALTDKARASLVALMHRGPFVQIGHYNHDHPDAGHTSELWWTGAENSYTSRIHECFADQFVAAFAPAIWDGSGVEGSSGHWPRFVHWTEDHAEIRHLTLADAEPLPTNPRSGVRRRRRLRLRRLIKRRRDAVRSRLRRVRLTAIIRKIRKRLRETP